MSNLDLIIVGAGMAGLCAARTAVELGLNVLVLEKGIQAGGTTGLSDGIFNSCDPARQFPIDVHDSPEKHFLDILEYGHGKGHPELIKKYTYGATEALNWLEHIGFKFERSVTQEPGTLYPRSHKPIYGDGESYINFLLSHLNSLSCTISYGSNVVGFKKDDSQPLSVVFEHGKNTIELTPRFGVILCAGGFCASNRLVSTNFNLLSGSEYLGSPLCNGGVLTSAMDIGAESVHMSYFELSVGDSAIEQLLLNPAEFILVNAEGRRFCREDLEFSSLCEAVLRQSGHCASILYFGSGNDSANRPQKIEDRFSNALAQYRKACEIKSDEAFGKNPFYLKKVGHVTKTAVLAPKIMASLGGLNVNEFANVLDRNRQPIKGLFAAGEIVGGIFGEACSFGDNLASAAVFARVAVREALKI